VETLRVLLKIEEVNTKVMTVRGLAGLVFKEKQGLGDVIESFTKTTRIDKVAKFVANTMGLEDCKCGERKEALNQKFPFNKK